MSSSSPPLPPPSHLTTSDENHSYQDISTSSSSCFSTSSTCSSPDIQHKEYVLLNNKTRRKKRAFIPDDKKDPIYWSQRSKNNLSAKRSRVKRRMNDLVLETKVTQLNNENEILRAKIDMLSRKFGHLTSHTDEEQVSQDKSDPTQVLNLLEESSKINSPEEQSLIEKPSTTVLSPMPMKWRFKLFNITSNS